ncbi:hydrophobic compound transporter HcuB [Pseudoxanthomonas sangjuensis]|uniref:PQQ-dependent sugar dehydrogenase n=1 Tax=Pseudoxanthomonas sangjuensis TaxID=1503750 RepID=UPI001391DA88|nr:PQQ-dependent sugar dehydrogenase [Pseudoxanthomonas sangjuensis]KAF1715121.1 oxidoreductase [Pseudoxanthomonas sangjuensis]
MRCTLFVLLLPLLAACRSGDAPPPATPPHAVRDAVPSVHASEKGDYAVTELVAGLDHPWSLAFLPEGGMLVTERPGRLRRIGADGRVSEPIAGLPKLFVEGQAGLLDVALSPDFVRDRLVYLSFAEPNLRGNVAGTAVARGRLQGGVLQDVEVVYRQEPKLSAGTHVGSRLVFDDAGHLFVTQGDNRVAAAAAQELDKLQGKLVRIWPDGRIPDDNPFAGRAGARPEIWSYGHRNMQGAALHPRTRRLWTSEHGPMGGDEINIEDAGANYGWPLATHGINYDGKPMPGSRGRSVPGMQDPHYVWEKSPAVSGMAFYTGDLLPQWKGNLFLGALAAKQLIRLELDGDRVVHEERLLTELGQRIRDVRQGPDGALYVLTDEDDGRLLRIAPAP